MARELTRIQVLPSSGRAIRTAQKAMRETGSIGTSPAEIMAVLGYASRTPQSNGEGQVGEAQPTAETQPTPRRAPLRSTGLRRPHETAPGVTHNETTSTNDRQTEEVDTVSTRRRASSTQTPQEDSPDATAVDPSVVSTMSGQAPVDRVNAVEPPSPAETAEPRSVIVHNHGPAVAFYARPVDKATNGLTRGTAATG